MKSKPQKVMMGLIAPATATFLLIPTVQIIKKFLAHLIWSPARFGSDFNWKRFSGRLFQSRETECTQLPSQNRICNFGRVSKWVHVFVAFTRFDGRWQGQELATDFGSFRWGILLRLAELMTNSIHPGLRWTKLRSQFGFWHSSITYKHSA